MTGDSQHHHTVIINQPISKSNGIGTAGFILSLIALVLGWVPVIGWLIWILGLIFSAIGIFKKPRGLSIAGIIVSLVGFMTLCIFTYYIRG